MLNLYFDIVISFYPHPPPPGYIFHEAHGIAPVKIETNYPDVVSIFMPRDGNGTYGAHQRFVLQVFDAC